MDKMITAQEAYDNAKKSLAISTEADIVKRFLPYIREIIQDASENDFMEVHWDCSREIELDEDAKDLVKLQVYLQSLGYEATIVVPRDDFENEEYDYYYIKISWGNVN